MQLDIKGAFELIPESSSSHVGEVKTNLLLYPLDSYRQKLLEFNSFGKVEDKVVKFNWDDEKLGKKEFSYSALVETNNERREVHQKIPFPLELKEFEEYLKPTQTIDSDNPKIIAQATELAEGEDDLFKVVFKLASRVEENVEYDLNTLTTSASQKASWVLENKRGVCDEISSLFVAMCRALGIPARFVSGISYSSSELFTEPWQPHGWAEVYFPNLGWISFDITFGEFGYIDVTHLKLRDGFDPAEAATTYEWYADKVKLQAEPLQLRVEIKRRGTFVPEAISLEQEILAKEAGLGSYNIIKGIVKNNEDYYAATTLKLAVPPEVKIIGRDRRNLLLGPREVKETYWVIKMSEFLDADYWYHFPTIIYSEKGISVEDGFNVQSGNSYYSQEEIEKLNVKDEEKSYSRKISFNCEYEKEIKLNQQMTIKCEIKNSGNTNLRKIDFCLGDVCKLINLPINQKESTEITVRGMEAGWGKIIVSAENDLIEKKDSLEYQVLDPPNLEWQTTFPQQVNYGEDFRIDLEVKRASFSFPKKVVILIKHPGFENKWEMEELINKEDFTLELKEMELSWKNEFEIFLAWEDKEGKKYSAEEKIVITARANNFLDHIKILFNRMIKMFY